MSLTQFRSCCRDLFLDLGVYFDVFSIFLLGTMTLNLIPSFLLLSHTMLSYIRLSWRFHRFFSVLCRSQLLKYSFHYYVYCCVLDCEIRILYIYMYIYLIL